MKLDSLFLDFINRKSTQTTKEISDEYKNLQQKVLDATRDLDQWKKKKEDLGKIRKALKGSVQVDGRYYLISGDALYNTELYLSDSHKDQKAAELARVRTRYRYHGPGKRVKEISVEIPSAKFAVYGLVDRCAKKVLEIALDFHCGLITREEMTRGISAYLKTGVV
jgi:hypothetical protein